MSNNLKKLAAPFPEDLLEEEVSEQVKDEEGNLVNLVRTTVPMPLIQDRLSDVFGLLGWEVFFENLEGGATKCLLRVTLDEQICTKTGIGKKANPVEAAGEAFASAARQFGVGLEAGISEEIVEEKVEEKPEIRARRGGFRKPQPSVDYPA
jgi:hypothetical protein